jgi:hypothetical protein
MRGLSAVRGGKLMVVWCSLLEIETHRSFGKRVARRYTFSQGMYDEAIADRKMYACDVVLIRW